MTVSQTGEWVDVRTEAVPGPATDRWSRVRARIAAVEEGFGDPWDRSNPVGHTALLAADEEGELSRAGVELYDRLGLNAEFVPTRLGGRMDGLDTLGVLMRPLFRRDATLAVGCALTSLMGAMVVWLNGDEAQQRRTAALLLSGGRATIAFQRFAHENDFVGDEFTTERGPGGILIKGRKGAINNADTAGLLVAFARAGTGSGSHSLLLLDPAAVPQDRVRHLPRHRTDAARGLRISGLEFTDCPLPQDALVGAWGQGTELGLRAFPVIHATVPSMVVGMADTALRTAARFALEKKPFSRPVTEVSLARNALAGTFTDLLIADSLALTAGRALHLIPENSNVLSAVVKYLVPKLVGETLYHLSVIMGDAFHSRHGDHAIFQKHVRDLAMVTFGHVSSALCQATIAPCLPDIAAAGWTAPCAAPAGLFRAGEEVPPIDPERLARFGGRDGLCAYALLAAESCAALESVDGSDTARTLSRQTELLVAELTEIRERCLRLGTENGRFVPDSKAFPLTDRYALAVAAACCLGVRSNAEPGSLAAGTDWLVLALHRILRRLGLPTPPLPQGLEVRMCEEVLRRARGARSYDLYDTELAR